MGLRIRFRGGDLAGQVFTFDDDADRIVIGRDPQHCDLVIPPAMVQVGREHLALRRILGRYRLVLNRDNPVFVDGEPGYDGQELPEVAYLRLGAEGPELVAQTLGQAAVPDTEIHGASVPHIHDVVQKTAARSRITRWVGLVALLGLAVAITWVIAATGRSVRSVTEEQDRVRGLLDEKTEELTELAERHRRSTASLRERLTDVDESVKRITPDVSGLREAVAGLGPRMEGMEARLLEKAPELKRVLARAAPSVYVVLIRDERGVEHAIATAWVAGDGLLATNGHVALYVDRVAPGGDMASAELIVRSPGAEPHDHLVTGCRIHPGFQAFLDLWSEYRPTGMSPQGRLHVLQPAGAACDVALLEVGEPHALAPPLPIASTQALHVLGAGDVVGLVGYPSEEMSVGGVNLARPSPTTQIAHVTAVTNYFLAAAEPLDAHLVQNSLPVTGGASGSPIFDDKGRVVAVLSAGNIEVNPLGQRAPSAVLVNFAQRADLVVELLDQQADAAQAPRTAQWRTDIATLMSLRSAAEKGALGYLERYLDLVSRDAGLVGEEVADLVGAVDQLEVRRPWLAQHDEDLEMDAAGVYVFFVYGLLGQDMNLAVLHETDDTQVIGDVQSPDWYAALRVEADGPAKVRARITGPRDAEYRVLLYRFAP